MKTKLLYFPSVTEMSAALVKKCKDCSYRQRGELCYRLRAARCDEIVGKIAVLIDRDTESVIAWGGVFTCDWNGEELMVYTRATHRRCGYGTIVVRKLLAHSNSNSIAAYTPEHDPYNKFYKGHIADSRLHVENYY